MRACNLPLWKIGRNFGRIYPTCAHSIPNRDPPRLAFLVRRHYISRVEEATPSKGSSLLFSFSNGFSLKVFLFFFFSTLKKKERWKFRGLLDFRPSPPPFLFLPPQPGYFRSRSSGGFATQTPDTKTKSRSVREKEREGKGGGKTEGERGRVESRALVTDCRRIFFCAASASLKLNIDFASRAFQAGLPLLLRFRRPKMSRDSCPLLDFSL